jgi:GTP-binding protein
MTPRGEYTLLQFSIPARGLIGIRTRMLNATQGTAIIHHRFSGYQPMGTRRDPPQEWRSHFDGSWQSHRVFALRTPRRSELFVAPGDDVYEGMIVGENARDNDLVVNPTKEKKLTNVRAAGSDENIILKPPRQLFLEAALEYVEDDELVEVTPNVIRLRKVYLRESDRKRQSRSPGELAVS